MRPIKTSKSNYFVIHMGMAAEYEMKDKILTEMGIEWQKKFVEYAVERYQVYVSREIDVSANIRKGLSTRDFEYLASLLEEDKNKKYPTNTLILLEIFVVQFLLLYATNNININKGQLSDWFDKDTFDFYINNVFADKEISKSSSFVGTLFIETEELLSEVKQLINGYEIYLKEIEKGTKSKTSICNHIKTKIFGNKTSNVRQEFDRYDRYFNKFKGSNPELDKVPNKLKIELLQKCLSVPIAQDSVSEIFK